MQLSRSPCRRRLGRGRRHPVRRPARCPCKQDRPRYHQSSRRRSPSGHTVCRRGGSHRRPVARRSGVVEAAAAEVARSRLEAVVLSSWLVARWWSSSPPWSSSTAVPTSSTSAPWCSRTALPSRSPQASRWRTPPPPERRAQRLVERRRAPTDRSSLSRLIRRRRAVPRAHLVLRGVGSDHRRAAPGPPGWRCDPTSDVRRCRGGDGGTGCHSSEVRCPIGRRPSAGSRGSWSRRYRVASRAVPSDGGAGGRGARSDSRVLRPPPLPVPPSG